jgi:hypothetical protein
VKGENIIQKGQNMKTQLSRIVIGLVAFAALATPPGASARNPSDSRHPDPRGRQEYRSHQPQRQSPQFQKCYWSVPPPCPQPVVVYPGYCPPPPPVACWGYYPPPPPVYCYPRYHRPAFNFVFRF